MSPEDFKNIAEGVQAFIIHWYCSDNRMFMGHNEI